MDKSKKVGLDTLDQGPKGHRKENKVWEIGKYKALFKNICLAQHDFFSIVPVGCLWPDIILSQKHKKNPHLQKVIPCSVTQRGGGKQEFSAHKKTKNSRIGVLNFNGDTELKVLSFNYMLYKTGGQHTLYTVITHTNLLPSLSTSLGKAHANITDANNTHVKLLWDYATIYLINGANLFSIT